MCIISHARAGHSSLEKVNKIHFMPSGKETVVGIERKTADSQLALTLPLNRPAMEIVPYSDPNALIFVRNTVYLLVHGEG